MNVSNYPPLKVRVIDATSAVSSAELTPRQSARLAEFAREYGKSLAEMMAVAVHCLTEPEASVTIPDSISRADEEEHQMRCGLRKQRANN